MEVQQSHVVESLLQKVKFCPDYMRNKQYWMYRPSRPDRDRWGAVFGSSNYYFVSIIAYSINIILRRKWQKSRRYAVDVSNTKMNTDPHVKIEVCCVNDDARLPRWRHYVHLPVEDRRI